MNKESLIRQGTELLEITDVDMLSKKFEDWKRKIIVFLGDDTDSLTKCRMQMHIIEVPFGTREEKLSNYKKCIDSGICILNENRLWGKSRLYEGALEEIIHNFNLFLQTMYRTEPENRATLSKQLLDRMEINNEYDVQHIMFALIKSLYPGARREVVQDSGYGSVRFDIWIDEIDTAIEIKCTRKDHTEKKLLEELGQDGYFYKCTKLIMYVYDKQNVIRDVKNFITALSRTSNGAGKEVEVFVDQQVNLI